MVQIQSSLLRAGGANLVRAREGFDSGADRGPTCARHTTSTANMANIRQSRPDFDHFQANSLIFGKLFPLASNAAGRNQRRGWGPACVRERKFFIGYLLVWIHSIAEMI
jgi:hypothetical protein